MPDVKLVVFPRGRLHVALNFLYELVHLVADVGHQLVHFGLRAFHEQFDAAIGKVADVAVDVVAEGEVFDREAKPDALDAAGEAGKPTAATSTGFQRPSTEHTGCSQTGQLNFCEAVEQKCGDWIFYRGM